MSWDLEDTLSKDQQKQAPYPLDKNNSPLSVDNMAPPFFLHLHKFE
ncbi:1915_t:CDS:1, partial [Ambispora gerdemannii]